METNNKLKDAQLEKVNAGAGTQLHTDTIAAYVNQTVIYEDTHDGKAEHKVIIKEVNMGAGYVNVTPADSDSKNWFMSNHKDASYKKQVRQIGSHCLTAIIVKGSSDITRISDDLYQVRYTSGSLTYFYTL